MIINKEIIKIFLNFYKVSENLILVKLIQPNSMRNILLMFKDIKHLYTLNKIILKGHPKYPKKKEHFPIT